jgi:hypothetical protein
MSKKPDPDKAAIRALDAEWSKAATANDFDRVVKFYAKDGSVVWPDQPIATGHKAIRASWKKAFNDAPGMYLDFKPTHIEITQCQTRRHPEHREVSGGLETRKGRLESALRQLELEQHARHHTQLNRQLQTNSPEEILRK